MIIVKYVNVERNIGALHKLKFILRDKIEGV